MMSIHRRLLVGLLLGLMVLFAVTGSLLYLYMRTVLTHQFDMSLTAKAQAICSLIKSLPDGVVEVEPSSESMPEFGPRAHPDFFQVWSDDGSVVARSPSLGERDLRRFANTSDGPAFGNIQLPQGQSARAIALQVTPVVDDDDEGERLTGRRVPGRPAQMVYVVVAQDRSELDRTLAILVSALLLAAGVTAGGAVTIVTVAVRRGLQPLQQVTHDAAGIDVESLDFRFSIEQLPNELQPICQRLNESLERLEQAFQRERRFTADAAHELRTLADVALKWQGDPDSSRAYFQDAQDIAQQMEAIVTNLLSLARCQSGTMTVSRQPVVVREVVEEAWACFAGQAAKKGLVVTWTMPAEVVLDTDRTILLSMVSNLLSNAVEYTLPGGKVAGKAELNGTDMSFSIANDCGSLTPEDLAYLFEAFWRKDTARTDDRHCGLGLTLVDAYAKSLGGKVEARMSNPSSLRVTLVLPIHVTPVAV